MTNNKLDTRLEPSSSKKPQELKFTDYSIDKYKPEFKGRKKINAPIKDSGIKGLKLKCVEASGNKFFIQNFWFNNISDYWTVGEFNKDKFGIKECKTKVVALMEDHTDDNGLWIKSPKITAKQQKARVKKAELEDRKRKTVAECIELLCKAGFPKIKREGTICGQGIMGICLHLIGKNKRTKLLDHDDDEFGNGFVTFRDCKVYNTKKPQDWDDLFSKFPSGHGVLKVVNGRKVNGLSMYDHSVFSKYLIEELTPGLINDYLDEYPRGYGTKRKMIYALQVLWQHSKKYMGVTKPLNPTSKEALEIKLPGISKAKNSQYNRRKNGPDELQKMWLSFQGLNTKHPFQAECSMLMMVSGKHFKELSKVKKSDIYPVGNKNNAFGTDNIIVLPSGTMKGREDGYITITEPVQFVLDQLDELYKRPGLMKYKFIPWLYPSTKSSPHSWIDKETGEISQSYINSKRTRIASIRECWKSMLDDTGLANIVPRMLRKSYSSMSVDKLGTSSKARKLTGHKKTSTLDIHYDIHNTDNIKDYANEVADSFEWTHKDNT
tara:strand:- start:344 stop:1990 length:1647 start_codon:yes stop_codon:yes gene_type:complete